ncbi:MAG: glycoside hydrolase, partial [Bacteroidota bacterium]|nr:glycoside hydrolase [Bacteroidota bacterium]
LICAVAICFAAVIADMNGKWSGVLNAPDGNQYPLAYTFKIDGNKLTGTLETTGISVPIDSGSVSGNNIKFSVTVDGRAYAHWGKYYAGADSVGMDVDFAGTKTHTTLKRTP